MSGTRYNSTGSNTKIVNCTTSNTIGEKLMGKKLYVKGDAMLVAWPPVEYVIFSAT